MRVPTLQTSRQTLDAISTRQAEQARLQNRIASGLRVQSPGDDPAAAAQAELARSRLAHIAQDQRATQLAASVLTTADGALAQGTDLLQAARETLVAAGNGGYNLVDRQALALQLRNTREQLLKLANSGDGAGGYVFGGQGSPVAPLTGTMTPTYDPAAGTQRVGENADYEATVDGEAVFMNIPQGNGVFATSSAPANTGTGWIGAGSVVDAARLTGHDYAVTIGGTAAAPTYTVTDTTAGTAVASNVTFSDGAVIEIDGQRVQIHGKPAPGDSFGLAPAGRQSVFATLDQAIALLEGNPTNAAYNQGLERVHASLDRALDGVVLARAHVGEALRGVDAGSASNQQETLSVTTRRSGLEDLDLAEAISQLQNSQVATEAALRTYASTARKSLFDLLG
ncbi:MAG TPA: flagellar hook-associated protein FlgL [Ramlibacter sp.]|jgi:flagellar hook-associated protein 3 FlgL|uniref:flagellar hook-associated protein FlgL n=1 Tax=Ramlibacter sp. TaxID=1917967 RepID=UPI002D62232D|nr:flagellar hook-associated protein FlgL [Ramlibacter sp.]HZY18563.1 flagellar hook-associated protein FlgL [Ramlibacter sp.]